MEITLFQTDEWLKAVSPEDGVTVELFDEDEKVLGKIGLEVRKRRNVTSILNPPLTPHVSPVFAAAPNMRPEKRRGLEIKIGQAISRSVPKFSILALQYAPDTLYWLGAKRAGATTRCGLTYRLSMSHSLADLWHFISPDLRRSIVETRKSVLIREAEPSEVFSAIVRGHSVKRVKSRLSMPLFERVAAASIVTGNTYLYLVACDSAGNAIGGLAVVGDEHCVYYVQGGLVGRRSGSVGGLLIWSAIERLHGRTALFDFEGSQIPGVERFFRAFGATPYLLSQSVEFSGVLAPLKLTTKIPFVR